MSLCDGTVAWRSLPPHGSHTAPQALRWGCRGCSGGRSHRQKELSPFCNTLTPLWGDNGSVRGPRTVVQGACRAGSLAGPSPPRPAPCRGAQCRCAGRDGPGLEALVGRRAASPVSARGADAPPDVLPEAWAPAAPQPLLPGQGFAKGETENAKAPPQPGRRGGLRERPGGGPRRVPGEVAGHTPWPGG